MGDMDLEGLEKLKPEVASGRYDSDLQAWVDAACLHIERLEEALRPFADEAANWSDDVPDNYRSLCFEPGARHAHPGSETAFTVGDLRKARQITAEGRDG